MTGKWLEGQAALVTGGASGLGEAIVERFLAEGANVGVFDKSEERLEQLSSRFGSSVVTCPGDVRELKDLYRAVSAVETTFGKLDTLVANAGIWDYNTHLVDLDDEQIARSFDELFAVNVKGYLLSAKAAQKALVSSGGSMVFTISNAGFHADGGGPIYTASKHAVVGLVKQLAYECAPHVRVNAVAPGAIPTDLRGPSALGMEERSITESFFKGRKRDAVLPLSDLPQPGDYTGAYVLLASRQNASMATGAILNFDGGFGTRGVRQARAGDDLPSRFGLINAADE